MSGALIQPEKIEQLLSRVEESLDHVKTWDDVRINLAHAAFLMSLARQIGARLEVKNKATKVWLRGQRRGVDMIDQALEAGDLAKKGDNRYTLKKTFPEERPKITLKEIGVSYKELNYWRIIRGIPEEEFEQIDQTSTSKGEELTQIGIIRAAKDKEKEERGRQRKAERLKSAASTPHNNIIVGDFWIEADKVADNSLSLIFTDPPYDKAAESLFPNLADFAARKLAPGGSLLFYLGHLQLPAAFKAFEGKLRHWWTCACIHAGGKDLMIYYGVRVGWKPMLWFVKETRFDTQNIVTDTVSADTEKDHHEWQQAEEEAAYWIEKLCPDDGIVCDPFLGGGTTAAAAIKLNRKWIGFEIDPDTARIASSRLEGK